MDVNFICIHKFKPKYILSVCLIGNGAELCRTTSFQDPSFPFLFVLWKKHSQAGDAAELVLSFK